MFSAKLKGLEYETRIRKLVPADEVSIKWYTLGRQIRDRVLGTASKLAPQLAAGTGVTNGATILLFDAVNTPPLYRDRAAALKQDRVAIYVQQRELTTILDFTTDLRTLAATLISRTCPPIPPTPG